jgi:Mg-chelatase subunit ChlD
MVSKAVELARAELALILNGGTNVGRAFLLDISDSMIGMKLEEAKRALIKNASPNDLIIIFGTLVRVISFELIKNVTTNGETALLPAIQKAVTFNVPHMILITDGGANYGGNAFDCLDYVQTLKGVKIDTIGIGRDCDFALLEGISKATGGGNYNVNDPFELTGIVGLLSAPKTINL